MGSSSSHTAILENEMQDYLDLTFLSRSEIIHAYERFRAIDPAVVDENKDQGIDINKIANIPELRVNPFKDRIINVFAQNKDVMTFEDFIDMMSVFSKASPTAIKIEYAFRMYDFDNDGMLGASDIEKVVRYITGQRENLSTLKDEELKMIVDKVLTEADLDGDNKLSYAEFEHAMTKSVDFATTYLIRL